MQAEFVNTSLGAVIKSSGAERRESMGVMKLNASEPFLRGTVSSRVGKCVWARDCDDSGAVKFLRRHVSRIDKS